MSSFDYYKRLRERTAEARKKMRENLERALPEQYVLERRGGTDSVLLVRDAASGELLGTIELRSESGPFSDMPNKYVLTSSRIPNRRGYGNGTRRYKKVDSTVKAVKEYFRPTSNDEEELERLKLLEKRYHNRYRYESRYRYKSDGHSASSAIRMLAGDDPEEAAKAREIIDTLVAERRRSDRYTERANKYVFNPLREKIETLHSKIIEERG